VARQPAPAKAGVVTEPWQWFDGALCVDFRFARDLVAEIDAAGFRICR
jgi:hypothetical protein